MAERNVPISEATLARLREMAGWAGTSVEAALEQAVRDEYDRKFWEAVNAGYAALRVDPAAWAEVEVERKLWDSTLADGLGPSEYWTEAGDVMPPEEQERAS